MTNAELQIAIDAIRNATADGSVTNVMEADIMDALKSNNIPLSGTTEGNPVTGSIEFKDDIWSFLISKKDLFFKIFADISNQEQDAKLSLNGRGIKVNGNSWLLEDEENENNLFCGFLSDTDFSEINPTNKLIYAQRSYVEKPETLITALNNCDSTQLDEIKTILGII